VLDSLQAAVRRTPDDFGITAKDSALFTWIAPAEGR
jgi:hypothetical protein